MGNFSPATSQIVIPEDTAVVKMQLRLLPLAEILRKKVMKM